MKVDSCITYLNLQEPLNYISLFQKIKTQLKKSGTCWIQFKVSCDNLILPDRFAVDMIDSGWILRNEIIIPVDSHETVENRFHQNYEKIFFFTLTNKNYYFDKQLEPYTTALNRWGGETLIPKNFSTWDEGTGQDTYRKRNIRPNSDGKNKRSVWTNGESLDVMIKAGCPIDGTIINPFPNNEFRASVKRLGRVFLESAERTVFIKKHTPEV